MGKRTPATILCLLLGVTYGSSAAVALPAFPGAEGFGAETIGGRGGDVYVVSNLDDSGPGSLRSALTANGPRIVVFATGGTITTESTIVIMDPYITIAGQTAPGGGITIKSPGHTGILVATHDVVVRYLTIRNGSGGETEALAIYNNDGECYNVIVDHCSLSWATDEVAETWYNSHDMTFSWNIISEGLNCSTHSEGCHSKGLMFGQEGSENFSVHHNLLAHNWERNPIISIDNVGSGKVDVINNVFYNATGNPDLTWDRFGSPVLGNFIGNYHKRGPDSRTDDLGSGSLRLYCDGGTCSYSFYVEGNLGPLRQDDTLNEDLVVRVDPGVNSDWRAVSRIATSDLSITNTTALQAYVDVLASGGSGNSKGIDCNGTWVNRRDSIDERVVDEVQSGTEFDGSAGSIIDDESEVGGWAAIDEGAPCPDTDDDGMPDTFETRTGFNLHLDDALGDSNADGYLNIEEYINGTSRTEGSGGSSGVGATGGSGGSAGGGGVDGTTGNTGGNASGGVDTSAQSGFGGNDTGTADAGGNGGAGVSGGNSGTSDTSGTGGTDSAAGLGVTATNSGSTAFSNNDTSTRGDGGGCTCIVLGGNSRDNVNLFCVFVLTTLSLILFRRRIPPC